MATHIRCLQFPILLLDLAGNIIQSNREASELSGLSSTEMCGRPTGELAW
ncbi:MAG: hypothetical protein DMG05_29815 [Acidobacteria bacterium]|nr:MAG: hypothetical protein DMG05_29815 [Acidobacteriota bacterium]